jgi:hypothetical protein
MEARHGLREIERKAWLRTFEHGLWDIAIGLVLLSFGLAIMTELYWLSPVWVAIAVPSMRDLARRLIVPRIGHVTFKKRRQGSTARVSLVLFVLTLAGGGMFLFTAWSTRGAAPEWVGWVRSHLLIVIGLIWGGALAVGGWVVDLPRLYAYGVLLFGGLLVTDLVPTGYHLGHVLVAIGGLITLAGVALLVRFLRRYPCHPEPMDEQTDG